MNLTLILTKHAYERYYERGSNAHMAYYDFQQLLRREASIEMSFLEWKGGPAVYLYQAYWRYELDDLRGQIILITCLGILEFISLSKWVTHEKKKTNRTKRRCLKYKEKSYQ